MKTPEELAMEFVKSEIHPDNAASCFALIQRGFLAGYQAAKPQWIPVKERLPETHDNVLAYTVHNSFREIKVIRYEPNYGFDFNGIVICWMPLPEPPKEEE